MENELEQLKQDFEWVCNGCGSHEYSSSVCEADLSKWLACSVCGSDDFHKEYISAASAQ